VIKKMPSGIYLNQKQKEIINTNMDMFPSEIKSRYPEFQDISIKCIRDNQRRIRKTTTED